MSLERWQLLTISYSQNIELAPTPADGEPQAADQEHFYLEQIKSMRTWEITTLYIDYSHILEREEKMAMAIVNQYYR